MNNLGTGTEKAGQTVEKSTCWIALIVLAFIFSLLGGTSAWSQALVNPRRIAAGPTGQLLVADRIGSIVAIDMESLQPEWSVQLPDEGAPFGLAALNRLVFVGNTETKNVEVYRLLGSPRKGMELRWLYNLGHTMPGETGSIENPIDIAIDRHARLVFVLDGQSKMVKIFDIKGMMVDSFAPADNSGAVLSPVSVAVDPDRTVRRSWSATTVIPAAYSAPENRLACSSSTTSVSSSSRSRATAARM
jgi:hypothetical protein